MLNISKAAIAHFRKIIAQQDIDGLGVRLSAVAPGTAKADCRLEFCEPSDLLGDEWQIECDDFSIYVDRASVPFLDSAQIDFQSPTLGSGQLTIKAPKIKGNVPGPDASPEERIRYILETEINTGLASHGGRCSLVEFTADGIVVLQFGGGCHGCSQVESTVKHGVERTLMAQIPEVKGVRDVTDHATGHRPYYKR
ncbi:Fe-S biogenesis protein NfuA [Ahniella affigens]|uniref:Fe/S biogenesis protein NfuA n=1 Tax=Ahniella affigens TaxID=2021234 RepID=A0A2P1PR91_9GAMM|nr:NfuA family Fe-S biogenesis protein [Ahniella affigens]AVP97341.1 Fe-S biogenesis protein NfuA [Ahniella affigens]